MELFFNAKHQAKLENIKNQLGNASHQEMHIQKGGVSHFVPLPNDSRRPGQPLNIASLNEVLHIDPVQKIAVAEPGVTFAQLVSQTLPQGLMPAVVPELKGITLGGAVAGCAIEATSCRYGTFHETCLEYEVMTGTGEILICSPSQEPLLFDMLHGSYGTLGILTCLTFRLIPARPFVHMHYLKFDSFQEFEAQMLRHCREGTDDFIDAIIHGPREYILCLGRLTETAPYTSHYNGIHIFYKSTRTRSEDYLKTADYFFRYDADCHWLSRTVPLLEQKWFRLLAGRWFLGSTNLIRWTKRMERIEKIKKRPDVVCDVFIPSRNLETFFEWYQQIFDFYPLWVVPCQAQRPYPWLTEKKAEAIKDEFLIDCAIYGKANSQDDLDYSQILEDKTDELGGIKTLISSNHYTPERFWNIYNRENYEHIKQKVDPQGLFANLYNKFHQSIEK